MYPIIEKDETEQVADPLSFEEMSPSVAPLARETGILAHLESEAELPTADEAVVEEDLRRDSCKEVSQQAEISSTRVFFGSEVADENACALTLQFMGPLVPILPGFQGFDIPDLGHRSPRYVLANELDNPLWSRPMENRIYTEIPGLIDFPMITHHAVCRSNTCGVVLAYTHAAYSGGERDAYAHKLAEVLGFSGYISGERRQTAMGFTYIYLGDWEMPQRSEASTPPPTSFEEVLNVADENN